MQSDFFIHNSLCYMGAADNPCGEAAPLFFNALTFSLMELFLQANKQTITPIIKDTQRYTLYSLN